MRGWSWSQVPGPPRWTGGGLCHTAKGHVIGSGWRQRKHLALLLFPVLSKALVFLLGLGFSRVTPA